MRETEVKTLNGFTALSNEELETVDGGENLNELLKLEPLLKSQLIVFRLAQEV